MLSHFFNFCIERNYYFGNNPCKKKKLAETQRYIRLSIEQINEINEKAEGHLKTAIYLILFAGLRPCEILGLKWHHIDFVNKMIYLPSNITKTKRARDVDILCILIDYLVSHEKVFNC